jgi:hypothetical protein
LIAEHALSYSRARTGFSAFTEAERNNLPPVPQVMVRTIPENGRKSLYIASHIGRIIGMPDDEARVLVDQLVAHATQRKFVYTHRWRVHDLVMWDDRCTMHRGTDFDDLRWTRDMHRATVADVANTCEQEGVVATSAQDSFGRLLKKVFHQPPLSFSFRSTAGRTGNLRRHRNRMLGTPHWQRRGASWSDYGRRSN